MKLNNHLYAFCVAVLFVAAWFHADFVLLTISKSTLTWHLYQWLPLLAGALAFFMLGWAFCVWVLNCIKHSFYGWFGLALAPFAAAGLGYVLSYHIF